MNRKSKAIMVFAVAGALLSAVRAETAMNETRATLEKWVETRQLISKTKSDWQSDKEMLEQTVELLNRELKSVEDQISKLGTNSVQVEKERLQADASLKASNDSLETAREFAVGFEGRLRKFLPQLPSPLQDTLKPLANRLPADSANTKMAPTERVQVIVGVLNELDKFNNAVSVFNEKRKNDKGEEVSVQTIYVGLGTAYFVNDAGDFAGIGAPGANGWEWTNKPELADSVRSAIQIYRNEQPARFVSLPAKIN